MFKRNNLTISLCVVLSLLMLVDYAIFTPSPAKAQIDVKSAAVGAVAGAGIVLAAPAIASAVGVAGGALAGVGTAIVGGLAAIGGGIVGVGAAIGGAIASAVGAVGGFIAGIFASPLFIPALIIVGAAVAGYFIYRHYKNKQAKTEADATVFPDATSIYVTPTDYQVSGVIPSGSGKPVNVGDTPVIEIGGTGGKVTISDEPPVSIVATEPVKEQPVVITTVGDAGSLEEAHQRYIKAYQKYTDMVTMGGSAHPNDIAAALDEYRTAYGQYQALKASSVK